MPRLPRAASPAGRPILEKSPGVLFWGPGAVKIGFLAKKYSDLPRLHNFSTGFFLNQDFRKFGFSKIGYFSLFIGILTPGNIKIERGMKKYFQGLILRLFGLMGSSLVPGEGPR